MFCFYHGSFNHQINSVQWPCHVILFQESCKGLKIHRAISISCIRSGEKGLTLILLINVYIFKNKKLKRTRMHSSRMRTARPLTVGGEVLLSRGGVLLSRGEGGREVLLSRGGGRYCCQGGEMLLSEGERCCCPGGEGGRCCCPGGEGGAVVQRGGGREVLLSRGGEGGAVVQSGGREGGAVVQRGGGVVGPRGEGGRCCCPEGGEGAVSRGEGGGG